MKEQTQPTVEDDIDPAEAAVWAVRFLKYLKNILIIFKVPGIARVPARHFHYHASVQRNIRQLGGQANADAAD